MMPGRLKPATTTQLAAALDRTAIRTTTGGRRPWLIVDADRTLSHADTGRLVGRLLGTDDLIRQVFEAQGYTDTAFAGAAEVWSRIDVRAYSEAIQSVAATVAVHPEWLEVFRKVHKIVPVAVVTAGIPQAWRRVLDLHGWASIPVIGGCHAALDDYFVSATTKAAVIKVLASWGFHVVAAGDSALDLPMLRAADVALFVPDHKGSPALRAQLHSVPNVVHFALRNSRDMGLPVWSAAKLSDHLLEQEFGHAYRSNRRTAVAATRRRDAAR